MSCGSFEKKMADWLTRRLSPEQSQAMEAHRKACPACTRVAAAEALIHAAWRERASSPPAADLWPRIAGRIGTPERVLAGVTGSRKLRPQLTRWALASVVLAGFTAFSWETAARHRTPSNQGQQEAVSSALLPPSGPPRVSEAWSVLREGPQSNPLVDDPVGANLDDVWTYLKTENKQPENK